MSHPRSHPPIRPVEDDLDEGDALAGILAVVTETLEGTDGLFIIQNAPVGTQA